MTAQMDLLDLLSHDPRKEDEYRQFLDACREVAFGQRRYVSVNEVRARLSNRWGLVIEPRRYSAFWTRAVSDGSLARTGIREPNRDARGRNTGKESKVYRWVGAS